VKMKLIFNLHQNRLLNGKVNIFEKPSMSLETDTAAMPVMMRPLYRV
jgi:hypothetical protein